jgi:hypothetical protein
MRTIKSAYTEIKQIDPNTAITEWAIRKAVTEGYVPSHMVGNKYLFSIERLLQYFDIEG